MTRKRPRKRPASPRKPGRTNEPTAPQPPALPSPAEVPSAAPPTAVMHGHDPEESVPRTVVLMNDIDQNLVEYVAFHLAKLNDISHEPILVKLFSHGGDLDASWALYDLFACNPSPIVMAAFGHIGSGATMVFFGGDIRLIGQNATFFIHDIQYTVRGSHTELQALAKRALKLRKRLVDMYCRESGQSRSKVIKWMAEETTFTALQAVRLGFADRILPRRKTEIAIGGRPLKRHQRKGSRR